MDCRTRRSTNPMRSCGPPTMRCTSPRRRDATASSASTATSSTRTSRTMEQTLPPGQTSPQRKEQEPLSSGEEIARLRARVAALQRERDQLFAIVGILQEVSSSLHFVDVLQTIARRLGETYGLDRWAVF